MITFVLEIKCQSLTANLLCLVFPILTKAYYPNFTHVITRFGTQKPMIRFQEQTFFVFSKLFFSLTKEIALKEVSRTKAQEYLHLCLFHQDCLFRFT